LNALDVDLIWFGVFLIVLAEVDMVAPPLGILNFVVLTIAKISLRGSGIRLTITQAFRGVTPFIAACILFLLLLIAFPQIALWLPGLSNAQ
jgi:TRAP-type mannitol/chloroaromatic compound transport system permease large subunit